MKYNHVVSATFLSRPNRFIAQVRLADGREETVHVKNTGRCKELLIPGCNVYLEKSENPNRKTLYDLIAVEKRYDEIFDWGIFPLAFRKRMNDGKEKTLLFNIDSQAPNKVVLEWLKKQDYSVIKPEFTFGKSRFDFYLEKIDSVTGKTEKILMEVKGCTLEIGGVGYFPDAPTERGVKHLNELSDAIGEGYKSVLAFVIQMEGVTEVFPNVKTHPEFADALENAKASGVEVWFLPCKVKADCLEIVE
ncbi:MAG: DNA/RNA nuclease SfsA [Treponema sp.]|nr:DNA/RNA nuclease SfsA [Treponema sp.]